MDFMFPDDMGIGEGDNTVQLVLIYSSIAILYLVVAYIMFFRSFFALTRFCCQILFRKRPNEKEDPVAKEGEAKKTEEPKKDKKMKKKD